MAPLKRIARIPSSTEAVNGDGVSMSQDLRTIFMDERTQVSSMFMFVLLSLLVMMVVPVIRRGAANGRRGGGRGRGTASGGNRGGGSNIEGTGEGGERVGRGRGNGSDDDSYSPLTYYFERADRSVSCGDFHKIPKDGEPKKGIVEFADKYIISNTQKKTLKAIVRALWPVGPVHSAGKPRSAFFDDTFYSNVLTRFEKYYDYEQGISAGEARYKIKEHLKSNLKNLLYREKENADKRVSKAPPGTTRQDVKPLHLNRAIWDSLCEWWDSQKFKAMSVQNKENRSHGGKIVHTTGAKPYIIFRKELENKKERQLTLVEFYEATHEKKDAKGTFWTKEAEDMRDVLVNSWEEYRKSLNVDGEAGNGDEAHTSLPLSPSKRRRVEAEVLCRATKGPKKNRVFMEGRSTFSEILGPDALSLSQRLKPRMESARLPDDLLQHAIGDAACIVHALDARVNEDDTFVPRSGLDREIHQLAAITLPKTDVHYAEYIHVASSVVEKMLDKFGKTINEDTNTGDFNYFDDDFLT